jgi:apolipoprotein D and lipocalin family protein
MKLWPTSPSSRRLALGLGLTTGAALLVSGCAVSPLRGGLQPVSPFDAKRYMGTWHEIARIDHRFQKGLVNARADYSLNADGSVKVVNRGCNPESKEWKSVEGKAKFLGDPQVAALKVSFFGPFYSGYNVVALDKDYQTALVVGESTDYFWLLARDANLAPETVDKLLQQAGALGVDLGKVISTQQR